MACLVRRLGARLGGGAEAICPVGTSATVTGGTGDSTTELLTFASRIFDQKFLPEALVGESRLRPEELFEGFGPPDEEEASLPTSLERLDPEPQEEAESHVHAVAEGERARRRGRGAAAEGVRSEDG